MKKIAVFITSLIVGYINATSINIDMTLQNSNHKNWHEIHVRDLMLTKCDKTQDEYFSYDDRLVKIVGKVVQKDEQTITVATNVYTKNWYGDLQLLMEPEIALCWNRRTTLSISNHELTLSIHKSHK